MKPFRFLAVSLVALSACGGASRSSHGAASGDDEPGAEYVETHTEKTATGTRTVTITKRVVEAPSPPPRPADPYPSDARVKFNVERINEYRARAHLAPLLYDAHISVFASDGSRELAKTHTAHSHFAREAKGASAFGPRSAENQGDPNGAPAMAADPTESGKKQITLLLDLMYAEGPGGGHYDNMLNPKYHRVGVGLVESGGKLYLTNDFSD